MVLKFKVWRLQREKRKHGNVLVLRDKKGRVRKVAKTGIEKYQLTKWYEKYNMKEKLERLIVSVKLKENLKRVKRRIHRRGFRFQISMYGIFIHPKTKKREYRRYEIFKAYSWKPDEVAFLHDYLKTHVPESRAGIFVYHEGKLYVDEKDNLTKFLPRCICGKRFKTERGFTNHIKMKKGKGTHKRVKSGNGQHQPERTS